MKNRSDKKPILSISMLISGREEMRKSLESLRLFIESLPCEVILVDTGCNAEQRAFAEEYADKIIDFEWCDDFSAARNVGLDVSEGEWFLYLDDDEWFDDPKEIVEFFLSGEYKNYNSGCYVIRNYQDIEGTRYQNSYGSRMVKRRPDIRFVGRIHEYLDPYPGPRKIFEDFAHHYGYAYQDDAEARRHAERNIKPLLKLVKEEPETNRWVMQLAQEYGTIMEYEKAVDVCIKRLAENKKREKNAVIEPAFLGAIYAYLIISLDSLGKYEEMIKWLEKAMAEPIMRVDVMKPTMAFYYVIGARLYVQIKDYEKSCKYFRKYMDCKREIGNDRYAIEKATAGIVSEVFQESILHKTVLMCMEAAIRMEDIELAEDGFYSIDWSDRRLLGQGQWEHNMLEACCSVPYYPLWTKIIQTLVSRECGIREMYAVFLTTEMEYQQKGETKKISRLRRLVSELVYDHHYILYTKILWENQRIKETDEYVDSREKIKGFFEELFEKYPDRVPGIRKEVWDVAENLDLSMEDILLKMDYRIWKDALEEWCREATIEILQQWNGRIKSWKTKEDIRYGIFDIKYAEGYLFSYQTKETGIVQWEEAFWRYADSVLKFYKSLYQESVFEECPEVLPDEVWLALCLKELQRYRVAGDDKGALSALRKCIGVSFAHEKALEDYAQILKDEIQSREEEAQMAKNELEQLAGSLKIMARQQIDRKEYQVAKEILLQIQNCIPGDEETQELLEKISKVL